MSVRRCDVFQIAIVGGSDRVSKASSLVIAQVSAREFVRSKSRQADLGKSHIRCKNDGELGSSLPHSVCTG